MILILDILTLVVTVIILLRSIKCRINPILLVLLVFDIAYVMPIVLQIFLGYPKIGYYGFQLAISDIKTCIIYDFFVIIVQMVYYQYINKSKEMLNLHSSNFIEKIENSRLKLRKNKILLLGTIIFMLAPIFAWIFAPDPLIYFKGLGIFDMNTVETTIKDYNYFSTVIKACNYIGAIAIILSKFLDINDNKILKMNRGITLIIITILNGKRTFFTFIILALLVIDLFSNKNKRSKIVKSIFTSIVVLGYFVIYAYISGKSEYNSNWYSVISEYFFRGNTTKVAIYSILNPDKIKILDYTGQTILYNLLFFIPRSIWKSKPYQYPMYFTSAVFNFEELNTVGWYFQTGLYGEMISNFGLIGIFLGPIFIKIIGKISDKSKSLVVTFLGTIFTCFIQVFEYSDMFKIIFLIWIILTIKNEFFKRRKRKDE